MGLFGKFGKKNDEGTCGCACSCGGAGSATAPVSAESAATRVKVLGTGCKKCHALYENAVAALGPDAVEYVTDPAQVAASGVMSTPALTVDGKVVVSGRVADADEIAELVRL